MLSRCVVSQVKHNSYFLVGLALGLWLALTAVPLGDEPGPCAPGPVSRAVPLEVDEYSPVREERPLGGGAGPAARSVQRPRYYSTELGMRQSLLAGALSSEDALESRAAALNATLSRLQPALRVFVSARAPAAIGAGRANVVGFTDGREMLKPFHALKYLADNYLDEYDFFFLVSDSSFVNARRLQALVSRLSVSQHVYMGALADGDSHYCTLEGGVLLSNSVLRAVHGELDWCVRNSYSPHHHENLGRCVLHAAHVPCTTNLQGERYVSARRAPDEPLRPELADAVSAHPVAEPKDFYRLHAYVSRVHLEREAAQARRLRGYLRRNAARLPPGYRNVSWPAGLRLDPGLAPPLPENRFDHLRWTWFNATHALMPDDHRAAARLPRAHRLALDLVMEEARAWALRRWGGAGGVSDVTLVEGAWRWEPAAALRYRLLLRLTGGDGSHMVRLAEAARALGAARLVPEPYVTESARVSLVVPVTRGDVRAALAFLRRYEPACLRRDAGAAANTALTLVALRDPEDADDAAWAELADAVTVLGGKHRGAALELLRAELRPEPGATEDEVAGRAGRAALAAAVAAPGLARDALVLLADARMEFNDEFLNRVRMNTIAGVSWYSPVPFARHALYAHPRFVDPATGARPATGTGRFNARHRRVAAVYRKDLDSALAEWRGGATGSVSEVLSASRLRGVRAPEPALVLRAPPPPCDVTALPRTDDARACLLRERAAGFGTLELGGRAALARLLLEARAEGGAALAA